MSARSFRRPIDSNCVGQSRASWLAYRLARGRQERRTASGQVMIIFALAAVVLVGVAGLSVDAGLSYMTRTSLQAAGDTASYAGAQMLGADYFAEENGNTAPFTYSEITHQVAISVVQNDAGSAGATSYDAYFTMASSTSSPRADVVVCQFAGAPSGGVLPCSDTAAVVSLLEGSTSSDSLNCVDTTGLPMCNGLVAVTGVRVVPANTHPTLLESVVGIHQASERATATSVFAFVNSAQANYIVWWDCLYDPSTGQSSSGPIVLNSTVVYFQVNGLAKQGTCITTTDSKFKGDIKPPTYPSPIAIPGWAQAYGGKGSNVTGITAGTTILLPLVDCLFNATTGTVDSGTQCPGPYLPGDPGPYQDCGRSFSQPLGSGSVVMCIVGLVWLTAGNDCNLTGSGTTSTCWGTVSATPQGQGGVGFCEPSLGGFPICGNAVDKAALKPTVQLLQ